MLVLLMCHFIGDYYLQWNQLIQLKKTSFLYLLLHVLIYVLPFMGSVLLFGYNLIEWVSFLLVIFVSHMLIDMGKKYLDKWLSDKKYIFMNFCIDQLLHIAVLWMYHSYFVVESIWIWLLFIVIVVIQPIPLAIKLYKLSCVPKMEL